MSPQTVRQFRQRANYHYGEMLKAQLQGNNDQIATARKEFQRCHYAWQIAYFMHLYSTPDRGAYIGEKS